MRRRLMGVLTIVPLALSGPRAALGRPAEGDATPTFHDTVRSLETAFQSGAGATVLIPAGPRGSLRLGATPASVVEPGLAATIPGFAMFQLRSPDTASMSGRLVVFEDRMHAIVLDGARTVVVDLRQDGTASVRELDGLGAAGCETLGEIELDLRRREEPPELAMRVFRLAVAATSGFVNVNGGSTASALERIVELVSDANAIFEREAGVRLVLVDGTDRVVFGPEKINPFSGSNSELAAQSQAVIDSVIGAANYDIGHLLSVSGGGLAFVGSVCTVNIKANAVSGNFPSASGGFLTFVHELGHQLGASHSWNGAQGSCTAANRAPGFAYEPGSGSTIMSYGGYCAGDNIVTQRDTYFHSMSLLSIRQTVENSWCPTLIPVANHAPVIVAPQQSLIPSRTPFELRADATDPDGDTLSYCWEQIDLGPQRSLSSTDPGSGPIIRSFPPSSSGVRSIPSLQTLSTRATVPGEILPGVARNLTFSLTVRDDATPAGAASFQFKSVQVVPGTGPFAVQFPTTATTLRGAAAVRWSVANTEKAPILADRVRILLSEDSGLTYPRVLADSVANSGIAGVALPDGPLDRCRIRVQPVDRDFFDISDFDFAIAPPESLATLELVRLRLDDTFGNGNANSRADPGESQIRVYAELLNVGAEAAIDCDATLESLTGSASVALVTADYPDLARGQLRSNVRPFVLAVSPGHPCGTPIALRVTARANGRQWTFDVSLTTGVGTPPRCTAPTRFCPGDFNTNGLVDDADFQIFVAAYSTDSPGGDLDANTTTDDSDFTLFVSAYDALLCP